MRTRWMAARQMGALVPLSEDCLFIDVWTGPAPAPNLEKMKALDAYYDWRRESRP